MPNESTLVEQRNRGTLALAPPTQGCRQKANGPGWRGAGRNTAKQQHRATGAGARSSQLAADRAATATAKPPSPLTTDPPTDHTQTALLHALATGIFPAGGKEHRVQLDWTLALWTLRGKLGAGWQGGELERGAPQCSVRTTHVHHVQHARCPLPLLQWQPQCHSLLPPEQQQEAARASQTDPPWCAARGSPRSARWHTRPGGQTGWRQSCACRRRSR